MNLDFYTLTNLRKNHAGWRLLVADHAPLIVSFLQQAFIEPNVRVMAQPELESKLEDLLFDLRASEGDKAFPRSARAYLDEWAQQDKGWLRKFYPPNSDEAHFDLTPATEKAIAWLQSLTERSFVGTESRLMTVFELLRQMVSGSETDAATRIQELEQERERLTREIEKLQAGEVNLMDDTALRDRFQQVSGTARELLGDFREVEHNFRQLDAQVREQIATWDGRKGELLGKVLGERDAIADSDQGRSFRAFWDFLMSPASQDELTGLLEKVFELDAVRSMEGDPRFKRIHYDWLEAGEHTQRTVARLSQQLRRYLDDQAYLENKRIMELLDGLSGQALAVRDQLPKGDFHAVDAPAPTLELPLERPLHKPALKPELETDIVRASSEDINTQALYEQVYIDEQQLKTRLRKALQGKDQITLSQLLKLYPLEQGLAELMTYLSLAGKSRHAFFDDSCEETIFWQEETGRQRQAQLPRVIFTRV